MMCVLIINNTSAKARNLYTYTATGTKLRVKSLSDPTLKNVPMVGTSQIGNEIDQKTMDYVGNMIYENGKLKVILTDNGYYDCGNDDKKYYFYIKDHLGNNRIVADADGSLVQSTQYYPFGLAYGDGMGSDKQPFKYNGKELDSDHGLNLYDYSARYYEPAVGRFTSVDPLAEKYYSISPYVYCLNNPINAIDLRGDSVTFTADKKEYLTQTKDLINEGAGSKVTSINKNGVLSVKKLSDKQLSKLTDEQKSFYNTMYSAANSEGMVTIGVVSDSEEVLIGSWNLSQIDISDMNTVGEGEAMNKYSTFIHEIVEQQYKQTDPSPMYSIGHYTKAIPAEEKISGYMRGTEFSGGGQDVVVFPYTKVGSGTINVHLTLNKGRITNVQRIKK